MKELLIYIDSGFLENAGHYRRVTEVVNAEAQKRKVGIWHFVNNDVTTEIVREYKLEPLFYHRAILKEINHNLLARTTPLKIRTLATLKKILDPARAFVKKYHLHLPVSYPSVLHERMFNQDREEEQLNAFVATLEAICNRLLAKGYFDCNISFFMYTSHPLYFPIFAKVLNQKKYAKLNTRAHLCLFYLNPEFCRGEESAEYQQLLRSVSTLLKINDRHGKVMLYTDSERTIRIFKPFFDQPIKLIPVPMLDSEAISYPITVGKEKVIVIGFFGYPSAKQGYQLIKQVYEHLIKLSEYSSVRFVIRHSIHFATNEMKKVMDNFIQAKERIEHAVGYLKPEEYQALLQRCDIILIPHSQREYPTQTSGLFVEALAKGKVVVIPDDTWMSDQLQKYGAGVTFESENFDSFLSSVKKALDNFSLYENQRQKNIEEFIGYHTAKRLFDVLNIGIQEKQTHAVGSLTQESQKIDTDLKRFKNLHKGQRCFVVGNGPSLNKMNLNKLESEYVFCTNAFYLMFPRIKWRPQYYTAVDTRVIPDRSGEIIRMHEENPEMVLFFPTELRNHHTGEITPIANFISPAKNRLYFTQEFPTNDDLPYSAFSLEADKYVVQPYTVTVTALQLAVFLGFDPIYLIGCDTEYNIPQTVIQEGEETKQGKMFFTSTKDDDINHFVPNYFGKGRKWHNPQVENMIWHYRMAHEAIAIYGKHVYNATVGGKLDVFPRVNYDEVVG